MFLNQVKFSSYQEVVNYQEKTDPTNPPLDGLVLVSNMAVVFKDNISQLELQNKKFDIKKIEVKKDVDEVLYGTIPEFTVTDVLPTGFFYAEDKTKIPIENLFLQDNRIIFPSIGKLLGHKIEVEFFRSV